MSKTPEPLVSLQRFVRQCRKAERESTVGGRIPGRTAGEQLFGSVTVRGKKTLHRMALETDAFVDAANKYFNYK